MSPRVAERAEGWLERWLQLHGAAPEAVAELAAGARARARRFPPPARRAWPLVEQWLDRAAPTLLLGEPRPARALDDAAFDRLEQALQHHPRPLVRAAHTLARTPAMEQLYPDPPPPSPGHPLRDMAGRIRLGTQHGDDRFDVIVVGSGAGGGPVAWELARRGLAVAVVEAGGLLEAEPSPSALERHYLNQGMVGSVAGRGMTLVLAGEAVGGTTAVNSGTSLRPRRDCLAAWTGAEAGAVADGLDPWLGAAEEAVGVRDMPRALLDASAEIVERGLAVLGRDGAYVLPRNAPACRGAGRCCFGCPNGAKLSTDRSLLPGAVEAGAALFMRTRAAEVREERGGVEVLVEGPEGRRRLRARELVLAAGALATPHLIRRNRLGSRWRRAGRDLKIHPATKVFALMPEPLRGGGIPQGIGYRPPDVPRLTFEGVHTPASAAAPMVAAAGRRHRYWMERYDRLATFGMMVRDRGAGWVRGAGPSRYVHYALDGGDAGDLGRGIRIAAEAFFAAGAERVLLPVTGMEPEVARPSALRQLPPEAFTPERLLTCGFHPQGTAGVGRVTDADLRVVGCRHVWVADASALPDSPGVNPQVTIMALALRCADQVGRRLGRKG